MFTAQLFKPKIILYRNRKYGQIQIYYEDADAYDQIHACMSKYKYTKYTGLLIKICSLEK